MAAGLIDYGHLSAHSGSNLSAIKRAPYRKQRVSVLRANRTIQKNGSRLGRSA
jgi:hypothetical protein